MTEAQKLQEQIQKKAMAKLAPLFNRYGLNLDYLEPALKWKSMVLILGNFSSGKSTLINEIFETDIQRTGQSPTDDSFTILTAPDRDSSPREVPGSSLINDERLPFTAFKKFGEQFAAHFSMKQFHSPHLKDLAIIDSPGMLDAITEKDRGYDYNAVIGELARLADLVVLMFDPHKAGTIREVYETIRNTLPESSGEDRIIFVMSRIDECDDPSDLVRSYGTLCWNLSQMTGRKDIPRIFLTYSPTLSRDPEAMETWVNERAELKEKILAAPKLRVNHILQHIDKQAHELRMVVETLAAFSDQGRKLLKKTGRLALFTGIFFFLFLDIIIREFTGLPDTTFISSLLSGETGWVNLLVPLIGFAGTTALFSLFFSRFQFTGLRKSAIAGPDKLIELDTEYRRQIWRHVASHIETLLNNGGLNDIFAAHHTNLRKIDRFINKDLQDYYRKVS